MIVLTSILSLLIRKKSISNSSRKPPSVSGFKSLRIHQGSPRKELRPNAAYSSASPRRHHTVNSVALSLSPEKKKHCKLQISTSTQYILFEKESINQFKLVLFREQHADFSPSKMAKLSFRSKKSKNLNKISILSFW